MNDLHATRLNLLAGGTDARTEMERAIDISRSAVCQHVFTRTMFDEALQPASTSDPTSRLAGLAFTAKDLFDVEGQATPAGSAVLAHAPAAKADSPAVARLRAAGGVLTGRTNMTEFAFSGVGVNPHHGTPANASDPAVPRIPGGSSSGAAVSVASGAAFIGLGSDTGGSIRIPASLCGVVGLKPSFGRVSRVGIVPHSWSLDHAGPLALSVRDAALLLNVLAGFDARDPGSADVPVPDFTAQLGQGVAGLRIGVCRNHFFGANEADVEARVEQAIVDLAALGASIVEFEVPNLQYGLGAIYAIELASSSAYHDLGLQRRASEAMTDDVRTLVEIGRLVTAADYLKAEQLRARLIDDFKAVFARVDAIVTPASPVTAWQRGQASVVTGGLEESPLAASWRLTYPFNLTGLPALSLPCGFDSRGLPVGLQIAGKPFDEATVLRVAQAYENIHRWHERRAPLSRSDTP